MLKTAGSGGRLWLGKQYEGKRFEVEPQPDGVILLKPAAMVREPEAAWLDDPGMRGRLDRAEAWMDSHPPRESDLDAIEDRLKEKA